MQLDRDQALSRTILTICSEMFIMSKLSFLFLSLTTEISYAQRAGANLIQPRSVSSRNGLLDISLNLEYANYAGAAHSMTNVRLFNGTLPGPTIRLKAGDKMRILFHNKLEEQSSAVEPQENEYNSPDHGNLHFHGSHVSGELPSDDIRIKIAPGDSYQYETNFPANHVPGIHWMHPHVHGSSALQVGGSAALAMIVEDPPGYLPSQVEEAKEIILFVQLMSLNLLESIAEEIGDTKMVIGGGTDPTVSQRDYRMINGQFQPVLDMRPGEWQRWRIVYGGWLRDPLDFEIVSNGVCEMQLLAKDGIYINDYPRVIEYAPIPTGGRADIMVRCEVSGSFSVIDMDAEVILTLRVSGSSVNSNNLQPWTPASIPQYVQDVRQESASDECTCSTRMHRCNGIFCINENPFDPNIFVHTIKLGEMVERTLVNVHAHPYHQHVYPFQIVDLINNAEDTTDRQKQYFKEGGWHDVIIVQGLRDGMVVRYKPSVHLGRIMLHCHRLNHEDQGMMSQENVMDPDEDGKCECNARALSTERPTSPPITAQPPVSSFCFSGQSLVDEREKGLIRMDTLKIGDEVCVGDDQYSEVYSFGHRDTDIVAPYLAISVTGGGGSKPLEISEDHMVFTLRNKKFVAVAASTVVVGDEIDENRIVTNIKHITRRGAYAPFTSSGTILVDEVVASNYISLVPTPMMQWVAHSSQAPHRIICSLFKCPAETYTADGISSWVAGPLSICQWILQQHTAIQIVLVAPALAVLVVVRGLESVLMSYVAWSWESTLCVGLCFTAAAFYVLSSRRRRLSKVKKM